MLVRDFSRVIITLDNILIPEEKLSATPSVLDGLNLETETDLRILGCELIQTSGILLKLPQVCLANMAAVLLATKSKLFDQSRSRSQMMKPFHIYTVYCRVSNSIRKTKIKIVLVVVDRQWPVRAVFQTKLVKSEV